MLKYQADGEEGNNKSLEEENTLSFIKSRLWYVSVVEFSFESFRLQKFINFLISILEIDFRFTYLLAGLKILKSLSQKSL